MPPTAALIKCHGLANCLSQSSNGLTRAEAYRKLVLVSAADYRGLVGILSDPDDPFGVHKDFHAVYIFKHDKLHVASFWQSLLALVRTGKITAVRSIAPKIAVAATTK